jgi:Domain of unknown function (DUF4349)
MRRFCVKSYTAMVLVAPALSLIGCGAEEQGPMVSSRNIAPANPDASASMPQGAAADESTKTRSATDGRKIIYNAHIDLVTEDLNLLEAGLTKLISTQLAHVADSDRTGSAGATRHGTWKVRVPVDRYDPFVKGVVALGELVSMKADSQDVSEEYFDLDARQTAKKVEEERLLKHLADSTGKLEEILAVERELSRVRSEIERMQGRLRALSNLTSLATVTISASEIKGYVPPQAPTLGTRLGRTFTASLETLRQFGEGLLIVIVAIVPWLPILALLVGVIFWRTRRAMARVPLPVGIVPFSPPPPGR